MVGHAHDGRQYETLPGGSLEEGESPGAAALRELFEETGLRGTLASLLWIEDGCACYLVQVADETDPVLGSDPELAISEQILTRIVWRRLEHVSSDIQVARVIAALA